MLAIERKRKILELARRDGSVKTQELSQQFEVTEETIRRDLDALAKQGLLRRTHGGAADVSMMFSELPQSERENRYAAEKAAIARLAVRHVGHEETILLDASSTALELGRQLPEGRRLRVMTNSQAVIERLAMRDDLELVLLGGVYQARGRRFSGLVTEIGLRALRVDRFFFSGGGFDPALGIGEPNPEEARLKRAMLEHSRWNCALMDHTKLGRTTDHFFARPEDLDLLVTDRGGREFFENEGQTRFAVEMG